MAAYTAILEQADDHSWSAYILSPSLVIGCGESKDEAFSDLQRALTLWRDDLKERGLTMPLPSMELVPIEIAA